MSVGLVVVTGQSPDKQWQESIKFYPCHIPWWEKRNTKAVEPLSLSSVTQYSLATEKINKYMNLRSAWPPALPLKGQETVSFSSPRCKRTSASASSQQLLVSCILCATISAHTVWIMLSTECRLNTPPLHVSCCYWQPEMESSAVLILRLLCVYVWDLCPTHLRAHTNTHTLSHISWMSWPHPSLISSSRLHSRPANVLFFFFFSVCQSASTVSSLPALWSLCSAQVLTGCFTLCAHMLFFLASGGKRAQPSSFHSRERSLSVADVFLSHSSNRKMFCAQQIWESKQM